MSRDPVLRFTNVSKTYRIRSGDAALRGLIARRRNPPALKHAVSDLSFEIGRGEAVALLGNNGAGKTTALRLASRVARPSSGVIETAGTVGALLEVGSGIHPELTGRENIWSYGSILGMPRHQVGARFDEIVEFSELQESLDQQVKFYSSGMQLRLGFAIASFLEPDVFMVDEALSVGDARFQRRCLDRMQDLLREDRTLLYVSHNLRTVEAICDRVIVLDNGKLVEDGPTEVVLPTYLAKYANSGQVAALNQDANHIRIDDVAVVDTAGSPVTAIAPNTAFEVRLTFEGPPEESPKVAVGVSFGGSNPLVVCSMAESGEGPTRVGNRWQCDVWIAGLPLRVGPYEIWCGVLDAGAAKVLTAWSHVANLEISGEVGAGKRGLTEVGPVVVEHRFFVTSTED